MVDEFANCVKQAKKNCEGWRNITKVIKQRPKQTQASDNISMPRHAAGPSDAYPSEMGPEQLQPLNYINITNWSQEERIAIENE